MPSLSAKIVNMKLKAAAIAVAFISKSLKTAQRSSISFTLDEYDKYLQKILVTPASFEEIREQKVPTKRQVGQVLFGVLLFLYFLRFAFCSFLLCLDTKTMKHYQYLVLDYM